MKKILSNVVLLLFCSTILTGCFGHCADWNCSSLNPKWKKAVDDCDDRNFEIVKQTLGYKDYGEVAFSEIGQHISVQCFRNAGRFDIKKDKKYGHLFAK
ncbi:MAG: hypothetical protein IJ187_06045 [Neisseriaceae bacterium]|nr:hypothetical protein [Neisseriaceae bacterium]